MRNGDRITRDIQQPSYLTEQEFHIERLGARFFVRSLYSGAEYSEDGRTVERTQGTSFQDSLGPIEARLRLAAIVDSSEDAIISKDLGGVITSWNAAATKLFGYLPEEIVGKSVLTLIPPELHSEEPEILSKVCGGERIEHFETRRLRKSGELIDISLTISPIRDTTGEIIGISKIVRDISDRKRTEEALVRSERLAAVGRMAATISHEVNNPLEAVLNLGYLLPDILRLMTRHEDTRIPLSRKSSVPVKSQNRRSRSIAIRATRLMLKSHPCWRACYGFTSLSLARSPFVWSRVSIPLHVCGGAPASSGKFS